MNRAGSASTLPSTRIRRRRLRFSPSSLRQRFRGCSQAILLSVWILVGLSTYGLVWVSFWYPTSTKVPENSAAMSVLEENASFFFSSLSNSKRSFQISRKYATKEEGESSKRLRKQTSEKLRKSMEEAEEEFTTIGFWIIFILWGFQKVKERYPVSASSITERRRPSRSTSSSVSQSQMTTLQIRRIHREVIVRTLRRINQEREQRGAELISVEAIEAFQNALLQDQEVLEGLAEQRGNSRRRARGATRKEIDACLKRLPNEHDDGECIICLNELTSDEKEMLRVLPCNHGFHACCIDKWLKRSTQCPICKASVRKENASVPE